MINRAWLSLGIVLTLLLTLVASAAEVCTMQKGALVTSAYADIVTALEALKPSSRSVADAAKLARLIDNGRLTQLPRGTPVEVEGQPLTNGAVRIRLPGTSEGFWTGAAFLNCSH